MCVCGCVCVQGLELRYKIIYVVYVCVVVHVQAANKLLGRESSHGFANEGGMRWVPSNIFLSVLFWTATKMDENPLCVVVDTSKRYPHATTSL